MATKKTSDKTKSKAGQPTKYNAEYCKVAEKVTSLGGTVLDVAEALEVTPRTVNRWIVSHKEFCQSIGFGREPVVRRVKQSLFQLALGYDIEEEHFCYQDGEPTVITTLKHYPGNVNACKLILYNLAKEEFTPNPDMDSAAAIPTQIHYHALPPKEPKEG